MFFEPLCPVCTRNTMSERKTAKEMWEERMARNRAGKTAPLRLVRSDSQTSKKKKKSISMGEFKEIWSNKD